MKFSVLMSVYKGEKAEFFSSAFDSILSQTLLPDEIILVRDGEVYKELQDCIDKYLVDYSNLITYIPLEKNGGLGNALNIGVIAARNDIIARMDTDDICVKDRFERQIRYLEKNPNIDVLGGQILEFTGNINNVVAKREVPKSQDEILKFLKTRNPFNHMTVIFKKNKVIEAGNYLDFHYLEDYFLWLRMSLQGGQFANLEDVCVYVRVDENMYRRRGGLKYFKSWKNLEKYKLSNKITSRFQYIKTLSIRFCIQVLMPNKLRGFIFKRFGRRQ